jgi:type IV pilus assembly protein PilE
MQMTTKHGFSLIEIIIVLLILSILSVLAIPLYTEPRVQTQQSLAKIKLFRLANDLEQYAVINKSFRGFKIEQRESDNYRYELVKSSEDQYTIAAVPNDPKDQCGTFFLDEKGYGRSNGLVNCW